MFSAESSVDNANQDQILSIECHLFFSVLADIGGQLGLTIGASMITMCELIAYLCVKVRNCTSDKDIPDKAGEVAA